MEFKGQRKLIMEHLAIQNGWKGHFDIIKDIAIQTTVNIPVKSFKTVAAGLKKEGFLNQDGESQSWVINTKGMESLQGSGSTQPDQEEAPEVTIANNEEEVAPPGGEQEEAEAIETKPEKVNRAEAEKKAFDAVDLANEAHSKAIAAAGEAAKAADTAKKIAAGLIPDRPNREPAREIPPLVAKEGDQPEPDLGPIRATVRSRESMGLNEFQFFQKIGRDIGGLTVEKVQTIADVVFGDDPYNVDRVHANLGGMNVPIDIRKAWTLRWKTYLQQDTNNMKISPELNLSLSPTQEEQAGAVKIKAGEEKQDWDVFQGADGLYHMENIGPGGRFTKDEATRELNGLIRQMALTANSSAGQQPEPLSKLLEVLKDYLHPGKSEESKESEQTLIKWLIDTKLGELEKAVTGKQTDGGMTMEKFMVNLPIYAETLKVVAPIVKGALGIQEPSTAAPAATPQTAIAMVDGNGNPIQMNLSDLITFKTFEAEQKREDSSAKGKEDTLKSVRGFMDSIAKAAITAANQGGE